MLFIAWACFRNGAGPKGCLRGTCPPPPKEAESAIKNNNFLSCTAERKGEGHRQSCDTGLQMMGFKIPYSWIAEDITLLYPPKQNSETRRGALIPSSKAVGLECS